MQSSTGMQNSCAFETSASSHAGPSGLRTPVYPLQPPGALPPSVQPCMRFQRVQIQDIVPHRSAQHMVHEFPEAACQAIADFTFGKKVTIGLWTE